MQSFKQKIAILKNLYLPPWVWHLSTLKDLPDEVSGDRGSSIPQNERYRQLEDLHNSLNHGFQTIDIRRYKLIHGLRELFQVEGKPVDFNVTV